MLKIVALATFAVAVAGLTGCSNPQGATKALLDAGYTNIQVGGYGWGCGQDDTTATKFTATGPTGRPVNGVVCSAFLKGNTIRLN